MPENVVAYESLKPIRISPGAEVEGDDFFGREKELAHMKRLLEDGNNSLLIPGPRRWGKSSFIKEFARRAGDGLDLFYMHLHACQSVEMFYDHFLGITRLENPLTFFLKSGRMAKKAANSLAGLIKKVGFKGFEVETGKMTTDGHFEYYNSMERLIRHFPEKKIILTLDEISDFLIDVRRDSGKEAVKGFLKWLRSLRQRHKVQMILTGSINVSWALKELQAEDLVGDMRPLPLESLGEDESVIFFRSLLKYRNIQLTGEALSFCTEKIGDGIHYFIQVFADQICMGCDEGTVIHEKRMIETIYDSFLQSDIPQFSNFNTRLEKYFSDAQQKASRKILAHTAGSARDFDDLFALAGQHLSDEKKELHALLRRLCDEGYLVEKDKRFSFISALLADYWRKHYYFEE